MNILFERAQSKDVNYIHNIQRDSFKLSYEKYKWCPAYNATIENIKNAMNRFFMYKILENSEIIGVIMVSKKKDNEYEIDTMFIHPDRQNRGIGTKAVRFIEAEFPDAKIWTLYTPHKDYRNHHFYEKLGYKKIGENIINDNLSLFNYRKEV